MCAAATRNRAATSQITLTSGVAKDVPEPLLATGEPSAQNGRRCTANAGRWVSTGRPAWAGEVQPRTRISPAVFARDLRSGSARNLNA